MAVLKSDNSLTVNLRLDPKDFKVKSGEKIVLTPAVIAGTDTLRLDPVTVAGKRAWYYEVREKNVGLLLVRAGSKTPVEYSRSVAYEPWMDVSNLEILVSTVTGCHCKEGTEIRSAECVRVAKMDYMERILSPKFRYIVPNDTAEKIFTLSGRANIRFAVNSTQIDWQYAGNKAELDSIVASLDAVKDNPAATIREIHLTGYASPEGSYVNNVRLAKGRTQSVKEYVRMHANYPDSVYRTSWVPTDWQGLREWLILNPIERSREMIAFIDDTTVPVERKNELFMKRFPKAYENLRRNVYPTLRHTDYRITYNIRKYYDIEEIKHVMQTQPRNLSQNELYLVANSYPENSKEYFEVFSLAARLFPDDATANLNAANAAMGFGDLEAAEMYAGRAGQSSTADYTRGLLYALRNDFDKARPLLERAKDAGIDGAAEALDEMERVETARRTGRVTIL